MMKTTIEPEREEKDKQKIEVGEILKE